MNRTQQLIELDKAHVWHPFTPMKQWREGTPIVIDEAQGAYLYDTDGKAYIDGVSSLWCNVHGHRVPAIDRAVREQLDKVAHSTLLGLSSPPAIELAEQLARRTPGALSKVFYSDAGATAVEVAFKIAVGCWHHRGRPEKHRLIGFAGAYHGDTTGAMSVGYTEVFHRPFLSMLFQTHLSPAPDALRSAAFRAVADTRDLEVWPSEDPTITGPLKDHCLAELRNLLEQHGDETAAIVVEPIVQGAAGMVVQPEGFLREVAALAREFDALVIADEVASGFGRVGKMFACEIEGVEPDIMCLAKGISAGYLPLAATMVTDDVEAAFCGEVEQYRTLYHGHTYTGNPLACAAGLASLKLFDQTHLLGHVDESAAIIADRLNVLRDPEKFPHVVDIRQRGVMVGIELGPGRRNPGEAGYVQPLGKAACARMVEKGLFVRPLGNVVILNPIPAMPHDDLHKMLDIVIDALAE